MAARVPLSPQQTDPRQPPWHLIRGCFRSQEAQMLLHNKFVVVLGDSIQRCVYKDLVLLLQADKFLSQGQLKKKGEPTFENDTLVEGGNLGVMHNGVTYREVRQYRSGHHLVRFYFLTRVYSQYLESVLSDFSRGPRPDVVIVNSCIWDLSRYEDRLDAYIHNLETLFRRLTQVLSRDCLVIWSTTMPVGSTEDVTGSRRWDIIEGNGYSATLANHYRMDVVDMHYNFRFDLRSRCKDATHWDQLAHRKYTQILLTHIARAWGVECPTQPRADAPVISRPLSSVVIVPPRQPVKESSGKGHTSGGLKSPKRKKGKRWHPYCRPLYLYR